VWAYHYSITQHTAIRDLTLSGVFVTPITLVRATAMFSIIDCRKLRKCRVEMTPVIITTTPTAINIRQLFQRLLECKDKQTQTSQYKLVFRHKPPDVIWRAPKTFKTLRHLKTITTETKELVYVTRIQSVIETACAAI
jgi:hypothetical protein